MDPNYAQPAAPGQYPQQQYSPQPMAQPQMMPQPVQPGQPMVQPVYAQPAQAFPQQQQYPTPQPQASDDVKRAGATGYAVGPDLVSIDSLVGHGAIVVKQKVEVFEAMTGCETENEYAIKNVAGKTIGKVKEDSNCFVRVFCGCGGRRPLNFTVFNSAGQAMLIINKPFACCFPWCDVHVPLPDGSTVKIGTVRNRFRCFGEILELVDESGNAFGTIHRAFFDSFRCKSIPFWLFDGPYSHHPEKDEGKRIGRISKVWAGFGKELFTDADTFIGEMPISYDAKKRAILLAAILLIDMTYYETDAQNRNSSNFN